MQIAQNNPFKSEALCNIS